MGPDEARAWYVISLRPQGEHAALRRAAARVGAGLIELSPWALVPRGDDIAIAALQAALDADVVLFTSPAAVRFAAQLQPLNARDGQAWIATGAGTRLALQRAGITQAIAPTRMDSEGLLALTALSSLQDRSVGLVTAPDGRGVLAPSLQARGAQLRLAEIYDRKPCALPAAALAQLATCTAPTCLALSSGGALQQVLQRLPDPLKQRLLGATAIAASPRLEAVAREAGFAAIVPAQGPRPAQLMAAAHAWFSHRIR
ncbi:uroporphyrinogen-III synthase [Pseudoxanthomonas sp. GM95]|uniref:uroporphyrinogen-III synthase n=1 Tax=Pseudoxanthomonas sp. GM95 TaxID=1881043 RepID=UPI0008D4788F|nr:uroporphyrinogen-III synthase [Pseudoxanthomonas sp. GM95]SEM15190.1 uroporphyrinogen-III synthase [Pseudoxanthomonas sp. GM95]